VSDSTPVPSARPRSRVVLWSALAVGAFIAVLIVVLASSSTSTQSAKSPLIGKPAPAISGKALGGTDQVSLSQYGGRWVLVNFAASWCVPCQQETPQLQQFVADGRGVVFQVAYDPSDLSALAGYLKSVKANWSAVEDSQAVADYGVGDIPESYLVDPQGTVIAKYFGEVKASALNTLIEKYSPS
jgi:cytochrome c biogenesis protein CcmG, thiol:disulfide interchange protein DsbE